MSEEVKKIASSCWGCHTHCGTILHVKNGKVVKVVGHPENPHNRGNICIKGINSSRELTYSPHRPIYPLQRYGERGEGLWERISWDKALDTIATRLYEIKEKYGPESICAAVSNWYFPWAVPMSFFMRSIGTPNILQNQDLCSGSMLIGGYAVFGDFNVLGFHVNPDVGWDGKTKLTLCIGFNPAITYPPMWKRMRKAKEKGMKLIVVDPRFTETAAKADIHIPIRPQTDGALALAMLNVIINEKLYDEQFVNRWCFGFEKLKEHVQQYPPEWAEKITWVPAEMIRKIARMYATIKPAGLTANIRCTVNSVAANQALGSMIAITGNVDVPGGNLLRKTMKNFKNWVDIPRADEAKLPKELEERRIGAKQFPLWSGPESPLKACHSPSVINAILTGDPYPIKAIYDSGTNFIVTYPGSAKTIEALKKLEFLVLVTNTWTPLAEFADIVLPKTTELEENYLHMDESSQCIIVCQKAIEPIGESKNDFEIMAELLRRMEQKGYIPKNYMPWKSVEEYNDFRLKGTGHTFEELKTKGFLEYPFKYKEYEDKGFNTPSGKIELYSNTFEKYGHDPLPRYVESPESQISDPKIAEMYPLILIAGTRYLVYQHSRFRDHPWARKIVPYPFFDIHPDAAKERGIKHGDWAWIETPKVALKCKMKANVTEKIHPKVISAPFGWWYPEKPGPEHGCLESNINAVLNPTAAHDPVIGTIQLKGCACQVTKTE